MVTFTSDQAIIIGFPITIFLLGIIVFFTRPTSRRLLGALIGGLVVGFLTMLIDIVAFYNGWWYYPSSTTPYGPLGYYALTAIFYGAGIALLGWRVNRRFGLKGITFFITLFGVYGVTRDFTVAAATQTSNLIVFSPGIIPMLADGLSWITIIATAQLVMWIIAGPAKADKLRP